MSSEKNSDYEEMTWRKLALTFLEAGLQGDKRTIELSAFKAVRRLRGSKIKDSEEIGRILADAVSPAALATRSMYAEPAPIDSESGLGLIKVEQINCDAPQPIFSPETIKEIDNFINERRHAAKLVAAGLRPPCSILVSGPPGSGKTMLAKWLAGKLSMKLASFDLATSVSSFLGKTGMNLRRALDYARATPTLLLMDEFDAVAKRRDDSTDIGELKRVVNTLLKELEVWPIHSVLVAATNHENLLDPAIFRRFDLHIRTCTPDFATRSVILRGSLSCAEQLLDVLVILTEGFSAAETEKLAQKLLRIQLLTEKPLKEVILESIPSLIGTNKIDRSEKKVLITKLREAGGKSLPMRVLAEWFNVGESTIHHHLNNGKKPKL